MKYKVGDKVYIKNFEDGECLCGCLDYIGKIVTITSIEGQYFNINNTNYYLTLKDGFEFAPIIYTKLWRALS